MRGCKGLLTVAAVLILGLVSADDALAWREKPKHKKPNHSVHFFKKELGRMGFMVQEGIVDFPNLVDMCCRCRIFSCFANNPSSPYGLFVLPPAPNQKVLNPFAEWFTENQEWHSQWYDPDQMPYPENGSWFWRLSTASSAIWTSCRYFSAAAGMSWLTHAAAMSRRSSCSRAVGLSRGTDWTRRASIHRDCSGVRNAVRRGPPVGASPVQQIQVHAAGDRPCADRAGNVSRPPDKQNVHARHPFQREQCRSHAPSAQAKRAACIAALNLASS